jgi:hypothetical protein
MKTGKSDMMNTASKTSRPFFGKAGSGHFLSGRSGGSFFPGSSAHSGSVQPKLTAGQPNDVHEKEADSIADRAVRRKSEPDSEGGLESSLKSSKGSGSPLSVATKERMESSFGADFSEVKIHDNSAAASMSKDLNAQAFTHGNDIYFNSGKYDTNSKAGQHLLAHELTHTLQQPSEIRRFDSEEHMELGQEGSSGPHGEIKMVQLADDYYIQYPEMVAMADYFESIAQMRQFAAKNEKGAGTREEIEYIRTVKLHHQDGQFSEEAKTAADKRYYDLALQNRSHFLNPTVADLGKTTDEKGDDMVSQFRLQALTILKQTVPQNSVAGYRFNHMQALVEAYIAGQTGMSIDKALAVEAFGIHYLTDSFAAGHVITPRADISEYWNKRIPMFNYNLKGYIAQKLAEELSKTKAWGLASRQMIYGGSIFNKSALEEVTKMLDAKGKIQFGDIVSGALHDYYNVKGVLVRINGQVVRTYGDGYLNGVKDKSGNVQKNEAREYIPDAVRLSLQDVEMTWEAGSKHMLPLDVIQSLFTDHLFESEKLLPTPLNDSELPEKDKPIKWDFPDVNDLIDDERFSEALKIFAVNKADEFEAVAESMKDEKQKTAFMNQVVNPLKDNPSRMMKEIVEWTPDTGGGFLGHKQDDNAMDYFDEAVSTDALASLTTTQRSNLIKDIVSGFFNYVGDDEEKAVMKLFETASPDQRPLIYELVEGHKWTGDWIRGWFKWDDDLWNALSKDNLKKLRKLINEAESQ